ncbi:unnamed protein product, partial [Closterium sp. NIES-53]
GRQRAAPLSSSFSPTTAPQKTLHIDVWGPARVSGQGRERYFLQVVDDYTGYTTVFPLCTKGEVLPVLHLHSDRGGEFSSDLLREFCRGEGILQSFTLPASPQKNRIAERRVGLVMEVARTSMIHAAAPHFLWPFAVRYAAHQLNLWPRVSLPETSPTLHWTGKVGDASVFQVWGTSGDKLSVCALPCVFLGFPPDAPGWQFYHPTSRHVLPSQDVTFDESVPFYHPFFRTVPVEVAVDLGAARGAASEGAEPVRAEPGGAEPAGVELGGAESEGAGSGVAGPGGAEPWGTEPAGTEPEGAQPGGAEPEGAEPWSAESEGAESGGAEPRGTASSGGPAGASPSLSPRPEPLSPQQLREWFARRTSLWSGAAGAGDSATGGSVAGGAGATSLGGAGVPAGAGGPGGAGAAGPGGARTRGTGAAGAGGAGGARAGDPGAGSTGAGGNGAFGPGGTGATGAEGAAGVKVGGTGAGAVGGTGATGPRGGHTEGTGAAGASGAAEVGAGGTGAGAAGDTGAAGVGGAAGIGTVDTGAGGAGPGGAGAVGAGSGDTGRPRPYFVPLLQQVLDRRSYKASRPTLPVRAVRTGRRVPRLRPPPDPGTHHVALRLSSGPQRVPLSSPPASSLADGLDPKSDLVCAASPTVPRLLATVVTDPSFESAAAPALVVELEEFECIAAAVPHLVCMLIAPEGDPDAPDIPTLRSYAEAITGPYSSQWQTAMDAEMASSKSTGTYVDAVPPPGANIVDGMWIFRVKRPPDSLPAFKARYVARGFSQRQGVDFFHTFSPTPKMTTLWVLLYVATRRDYKLHSLDFSTVFLQGSLHEEIWLRRPFGFTGSFPAGTQWSLQWPVYGLRQAPREWHDTPRTMLAALEFAPSTADPSLFLRTDTSVPPFYILVYVDDFVFATNDTEALALVKWELQKRHTCTDLGELTSYLCMQITRDRARCTITLTQSHMVHHVLQLFSFWYSSPNSTPLPTSHSLSAPPSDESVERSGLYPKLVGCLMYLMTCTRPDLAYPLSILARYVAPGRHRPEHWEAAKRVLRYLCSTLGMGLVLGGRGPVVLTGHADASWVDDLATQRSSQGYTFSLGSDSVSWRSTRSSSVLISSSEAEIYAGAMAAQELRWLTYLLTDLGERPRSYPFLYVDSKAMIAWC